MKRALQTGGILAMVGVILMAFWASRSASEKQTGTTSVKDAVHLGMTNAMKFAKSHFTGGVGAVMKVDAATGLPQILQVMTNSPAEAAGLHNGDVILQVDGVSTQGFTLAQAVEKMRGFAGGGVTLVIQRAGTTNLQFVIHRSSWKNLNVPVN